jgi:hypothetical protein
MDLPEDIKQKFLKYNQYTFVHNNDLKCAFAWGQAYVADDGSYWLTQTQKGFVVQYCKIEQTITCEGQL